MSNRSDLNCDVHLHAEIEVLKTALVDRQSQLIAMETACLRESDRQVELEDSVIAWQDKYDRLYESHKRVQKVNQNLEDKLLKLVDRNSSERAQLTSDVATLSVRLAQANYNIATLQREIERYKGDMSLAIQLLQCKPDSFVSQKITSLPLEMQSKVSQYMRLDSNSHSDSEGSTSGVGVTTAASYRVLPASDSPPPMCPFPPTAMVYSMRGIDEENVTAAAVASTTMTTTTTTSITFTAVVPSLCNTTDRMISPSLMAKYLQDELKASEVKHCGTCVCATRDLTVLADTAERHYSIGTQTQVQGNANNALCLRCNSNLNSPSRNNSPYIMKLVARSGDSIVSDTKSSQMSEQELSGNGGVGCKRDDLTVNPILSHHRLCDRKAKLVEMDGGSGGHESGGGSSYHQHHKLSPMVLRPKVVVETVLDVCDKNSSKKYEDTESHRLVDVNDATTTGSTHSLWSKTSSNTTNNGAKMFETFNRNLIKSIQADNPKVAGPRLCALRIQNGTSNILLDNIESSELSPVVYTRRTRFLDEELDETKDIITSTGNGHSIININVPIPTTVITVAGSSDDGGNRTDYEKSVGSKKQQCGGSNGHGVTDGSIESIADASGITQPPPSCPAPVLQPQQLKQMLPITHEPLQKYEKQLENDDHTTMSSSRNANKSCTQSSSISSEPDIQESTILRRQQLTRVAEWVQNNHLDNIVGPISSQSASSSIVDAGSIDSGYKTKIKNSNNNNWTVANDVMLLATSIMKPSVQHYRQYTPSNSQNCIVSTSLSDDKKLIGADAMTNEFAQNNVNNNNITVDKRFLDAINNGNDKVMVDEKVVPSASTHIDFAQMEYNVKQFLLKQNEWSIHSTSKGDADSCGLVAPTTTPTDDSAMVAITETKLNAATVCNKVNLSTTITTATAKRSNRTETNL